MMKILFIFAFLVSLSSCSSNLYYCADFSCQEPISIGKTLLRYSGKTEKHLSFSQNEEIRILSKPDFDGDDWVAYCRGKVGLVPKSMVREMKMIKYDTKLRFPFESLPLWASDPGIKATTDESNYIDNPAAASEQPPLVSTPPILEISPGTSYTPNETVQINEESKGTTGEQAFQQEKGDLNSEEAKNVEEIPENTNSIQNEVSVEENLAKERSNSAVPEESVVGDKPSLVPGGLLSIQADLPSEEVKSEEESNKENAEDIESTTTSSIFDTMKDFTSSVINNILPEDLEEVDDVLELKEISLDQPEPTPAAVISEVESLPTPEALLQETPTANSQAGPAETTTEPSKAVVEETDSISEAAAEDKREASEAVISSSGSAEISSNAKVLDMEDSASIIKQAEELLAAKEEKMEASYDGSSDDNIASIGKEEQNSENVVPENSNVIEESKPEVEEKSPEPDLESQTTVASIQQPQEQEPQSLESPENSTLNLESQIPEALVPQPKEEAQILEVPESQVVDNANSKVSELSIDDGNDKGEPEVPALTEVLEEQVEAAVEPQVPETPANKKEALSSEIQSTTSGVETLQKPSIPELIPGLQQDSSSESDPLESQTMLAPPTIEPSAQVISMSDVQTPTEYTSDSSAESSPKLSSSPQVAEDSVTETPQGAPEVKPDPPGVIHDHSHAHHDHGHDSSNGHHDHIHDHHGHSHSHSHERFTIESSSSWSVIVVMKHLSGTLLNLLPEHLQDTILDVDSALVFTGIIALMLVSICVPYYVLESILSVRSLKKRVVELNKSLWKASAAFENQQEEFDTYKKKALAYDEDQKRIETLEMELQILKKLEGKQKDQVRLLQKQLKTSAKAADKIEDLIDASIRDKELALEENSLLKSNFAKLQSTLKTKLEELEEAQTQGSSLALDLEVVQHERENLSKRLDSIENELELTKLKLFTENENRRAKEADNENLLKEKEQVSAEMIELRRILHQYEENVGSLTEELTSKENELLALKESLGEDSPLIDISEVRAKLKSAEEEAASLKSRVESVSFENSSLSRTLEETKTELATVLSKKEEAENNLKVLEGWFHKKEEELRSAVAKLELEQSVKHKNKDDLIKMIREKESEIQQLISTNDGLKQEIEDMNAAHRNEIRTVEAKAGEHWLSLCQSERKTREAQKECEQLRKKLVDLVKEKDGEDNDLLAGLGDVPFSLPLELVPPPVPDDLAMPSYFPLDDDFIPPVPLPLGSEPMRPPPLGRLSPTSPHNNYSYLDEDQLSPISRNNGGRGDYSGDSSRSDSPDHRRPGSRENWMNDNRSDRQPQSSRRRRGHPHGNGPKTSSPIPHGVNL